LARKILLADDSVTAQSMGRRILTDAGYEVVTVNNGSAALKKVAEHPPDLLVLDVYMPGYGGLEVCQRLKNASETSNIPVLLTVGKLEPFKADEAKRVQADAYLIKPFEASELIAALIKLEDKIVPKAEANPPASFAKALAAMEASTTPQDTKFGDAATGWKDRLRIPSGPKLEVAEQPEPEAAPARPADAMAFRDFNRAANAPAGHTAVETEAAEQLLREITPDEIAAISAAAEALDKQGKENLEESVETPAEQPAVVETAMSSEAAVVEAPPEPVAEEARPEPSAPIEPLAAIEEIAASVDAGLAVAEAQAPATDSITDSGAAAPASAEAEAVEAEMPALEAASQVEDVAASSSSEMPAAAEAESFAMSGGGIMEAIWRQTEDVVSGAEPSASAQASAVQAPRARWIAEELPVSEEEASFLEREMQKAYAAMSEESTVAMASTQAAVQIEEAGVETLSAEALLAPAQAAEAAPVEEEAAVSLPSAAELVAEGVGAQREEIAPPVEAAEISSAEISSSVESQSEELSQPVVAVETAEPAVVEDVPVCSEEAQPVAVAQAPEPVAELQPVSAVAEAQAVPEREVASAAAESAEMAGPGEPGEAVASPMVETSAEPQPEPAVAGTASEAVAEQAQPEPALAAAASASAGASAFAVSTSVVAAENARSPESAAVPEVEAAMQREAELAAAWAQWRQIRDTVASPQMTSQLAEVAAASLQDPQPSAEAVHSDAVADSVPASTGGPDAIASIVDSVLAELKPRLVEEIAKKLGQKK